MTLQFLAQTGTSSRFIAAAERQTVPVVPEVLLSALANTKPDERYGIAGWLLDHGTPATGVTDRGQGALQILFGQARHDAARTVDLARRLVAAGASTVLRDLAGASPLGELLLTRITEEQKRPLYELVLADPRVDVDVPNAAGVSLREAADKLPGRDFVRELIASRA